MEIGMISNVQNSLHIPKGMQARPVSRYENKFNNNGVSPLGKWASEYTQKTNMQKLSSNKNNNNNNDDDDKILLNYNTAPQQEYRNIKFDTSLSPACPKDNIFSILQPIPVSENLKNLSNLETHLLSLQSSEKMNTLSAQAEVAFLDNKFGHLKTLAALAKY